MTDNTKKEDLRITKTYKALQEALLILLEQRNFNHITVNDLCENAQISRTTFYTHFYDKYDLLKYWLENSVPEVEEIKEPCQKVKSAFDYFISIRGKVLKNLLEDANNETMALLHGFMMYLLSLAEVDGKDKLKQEILSIFCAGSMVNLLLWQVENKSENPQKLNLYYYEILEYLLEWMEDNKNTFYCGGISNHQ